MDMNYNSLVLVDGRNCKIYQSEGANCLLIQPIDEHDFAVLEKEVNAIRSLTRIPFTLVTFKIKDWQSDLTPWSAPAVFGKVPFGDGAVATLSFITDKLIPQLIQIGLYNKKTMRCLLGGYSLAGFFTLWAGYQTRVFDGIVAASPSVWYPRWMEYAESQIPSVHDIYLSLGDKEEKTKNPLMAQVGKCICRQEELLAAQGINTILEWNPGNHFQHTDERIAKGFAWLINQNH